MSTTAGNIISAALQEIGVLAAGQTTSAEDADFCFQALNLLAEAWLTEPNYAYTTNIVSATITAGTQSATIGPGMTFDTARPVRLRDGCFVRFGTLDFPLDQINQDEYNDLALKSLNGPWPKKIYYDQGFPTGRVYFYPTGACTVNLVVEVQVASFSSLSSSITLPPGYERAFKFTLAEEVASAYVRPVSPLTSRNAHAARRNIKKANFDVPQLTFGQPDIGGFWRIYAG